MLEELKKKRWIKKNKRSQVATSTAEKYAKKKGLKKYVECSAKNGEVIDQLDKLEEKRIYFQGLKEVFEEAIKIVLNKKDKKQRPKSGCRLM